MGRASAFMIGVLLTFHGLLGLVVEGVHLLGIFNADILLDLTYILCGLLLMSVGTARTTSTVLRAALVLVAGAMSGIGLLGLLDHRVGGVLPTGLTLVDFVLFFAIGAVALITAMIPRITQPLMNGGQPLN